MSKAVQAVSSWRPILTLVLLAGLPGVHAMSPRPATGEIPVPTGWRVEQRIDGDLDGDGRDDRVLALVHSAGGNAPQASADEPSDQRALLALRQGPRGWRIIAFAPGILPCTSCTGPMGGGGPEDYAVLIEDGSLSLSWMQGAREMEEVTLTFAYDPKQDALRLVHEESLSVDRVSGREHVVDKDWRTGQRPHPRIEALSAEQFPSAP